MTNQKKNILSLVAVIILIILAIFYIYHDLNRSRTDSADEPSAPLNSSISIQTDEPNQTSGYTVEVDESVKKPPQQEPKMPDLSLPIVDYGNLDPAAIKVLTENVQGLVKDLKNDPLNEEKWLKLGIYRKMLRDYKAAVEILNYIVVLWPKDYVPFNNLADLYQYYIKNYPLAEKNWLKVIELKPDYSEAYQNLFTLYSTAYKDKQDQALPTLLKGVSQNPHSTDLMVVVARYYKSVGDNNQAISYYNKAIEVAKLEKNEQLEASLRAELAEISK